MSSDDRRLIEDYLPIEAISKEASREKAVRKGHISTLHLWWARRPLVACRAAIYGALVPASRFTPPQSGCTSKSRRRQMKADWGSIRSLSQRAETLPVHFAEPLQRLIMSKGKAGRGEWDSR